MDITKPNGQMEELTLVYPTDRHPSPWHCQSGSEEERGVQKKTQKSSFPHPRSSIPLVRKSRRAWASWKALPARFPGSLRNRGCRPAGLRH